MLHVIYNACDIFWPSSHPDEPSTRSDLRRTPSAVDGAALVARTSQVSTFVVHLGTIGCAILLSR